MSIDIRHEGPISTVAFTRPPFNLLDIETMDALVEAHREAESRKETRVIVTASGVQGMFSNGLDPAYVLKTPAEERPAIFRGVGRLLHGLFSLKKPHIAAINGPAMAGGAILAITADFRYFEAENGRISFSEPKVGLPVPEAVVAVIDCFCRRDRLREVAMLGANLDARAAAEAGLADGVAEGEALAEMVAKAAARIARLSPAVMAECKAGLRRKVMPQLDGLVHRNEEVSQFVGDDFLGEGLTALVENRYPEFAR